MGYSLQLEKKKKSSAMGKWKTEITSAIYEGRKSITTGKKKERKKLPEASVIL